MSNVRIRVAATGGKNANGRRRRSEHDALALSAAARPDHTTIRSSSACARHKIPSLPLPTAVGGGVGVGVGDIARAFRLIFIFIYLFFFLSPPPIFTLATSSAVSLSNLLIHRDNYGIIYKSTIIIYRHTTAADSAIKGSVYTL